ncbi:glycosyltransferase [Candidatus Falkowbacteria bacterium]|nr:glycosyltransferase [Candidatus Falkowbacteria bacterium]
MKILLINKFHFLQGGSEQVYFATKRLLEEKGHGVICFSMRHEKNAPCLQDDFFVRNVDFSERRNWFKKAIRFIYFPEAAESLARLLEKEKPDIAHLHNISHHLTPAILKPLRERKIPIVQTLHDYQLICPNYRLFTKGKVCERCKKHRYFQSVANRCVQDSAAASALSALELYAQWLLKFYQEKVDLFISPSQFLADKLQGWGIERPFKVVNNFIDIKNFEPAFSPGDYLVCVSRLSEEKGILTLLAAVKTLPNVKLKLVGTGPQKRLIEKFISENKLKNVEYLGAVYGQKLYDIIRRARIFIIASEWYENYPISVLEAMALGKPVLASDIGGLPEIVKENENGWLFPAGDAAALSQKIKECFNAKNIELLGRQARKQIEHKNCSERYYDELMAGYDSACERYRIGMG